MAKQNKQKNHQRFLKLLKKHELTPGNILLVFFSFWLTAVAIRASIFWLVFHGNIPAIFVKGYHIHHFLIGFLLLITAAVLLHKQVSKLYIPLAIIGCAIALIFDEFLFWSRGHFNYWSGVNLIATIIIGAVLCGAYFLAKSEDTGLSKKRILAASLVVILCSSTLFMLFRYDHLLNNVYAEQAAVPPSPLPNVDDYDSP